MEQKHTDTLPLVTQEGEVLPAIVTTSDNKPDFMALVQFALQNQGSVEAIERLWAMQQQAEAKAAKRLFDQAMAAFQAECPILKRTKKGAKSKYTPIEVMEAQTKELRKKHGFSVDYKCIPVSKDVMGYTCIVHHIDGHSEERGYTEFHVLDTIVSKQGSVVTNLTQADAGTDSYLKRYCYAKAFNIITENEDNDGDGNTQIVSLWDKIRELISQTKFTEQQWLKQYKVENVEELTDNQAITFLKHLRTYIAEHPLQQKEENGKTTPE